ncbi:MAG: general secretion pathway protein GspK [Planctomycetes bacterium]|nr:general secretion pathway protein GspK [Planctomycetota bacterium]
MTHPRQRERGTILVITMILIFLVSIIAIDARYMARIEWEAATNADVNFLLEVAVRGGYQLAEAYLRQDLEDGAEVDHAFEEWASDQGIEKEFDPTAYGERAYHEQGAQAHGGEGRDGFPRIHIFIEDEDRKYPLPLLLKGSDALKERRKGGLTTLLKTFRKGTSLELDEGDASRIAGLIIQFISREEGDTSFDPTPRAHTKSGTLLTPADLALIPEIDEHIIYDQVDRGGIIAKGLMHFVTVWTDLAVNVNTAPEAVLCAMMREDDAPVGTDIFVARGEKGVDQREYQVQMQEQFGANWRRDPDRTARASSEEDEEDSAGYWEELDAIKEDVNTFTDSILNDLRLYLTTRSKTFCIWVEAEMKGIKLRRRWVVRREGARLVPIISEIVSYPYFRNLTDDEYNQIYGKEW